VPERETEELERVAAIAAGMFAALDPDATSGKNGNAGGSAKIPSNWKRAGRAEGLR
jgi:hypothetical protein